MTVEDLSDLAFGNVLAVNIPCAYAYDAADDCCDNAS